MTLRQLLDNLLGRRSDGELTELQQIDSKEAALRDSLAGLTGEVERVTNAAGELLLDGLIDGRETAEEVENLNAQAARLQAEIAVARSALTAIGPRRAAAVRREKEGIRSKLLAELSSVNGEIASLERETFVLLERLGGLLGVAFDERILHAQPQGAWLPTTFGTGKNLIQCPPYAMGFDPTNREPYATDRLQVLRAQRTRLLDRIAEVERELGIAEEVAA